MMNQAPLHICHLSIDHRVNDPRIYVRMASSLLKTDYHVTIVGRSAPIEQQSGLQIQELRPHSGWAGKVMMLVELLQIAYQSNADLFHLHDPEILPLAFFLKRRAKVIYDIHEDYSQSIIENRQGGRLSSLISKIWGPFERYFTQQCDAVIAATPQIEKKFLFHAQPITVRNYSTYSQDIELSCSPSKEHDLVYVGGLSPERGIFDLLDALQSLPSVTLALAGEFTNSIYEKLAKQHPAWQQVRYLGYVDSREVFSLLYRAKIGVLVLWPLPRFVDSLPIKLFEYMAAGIPIIASADTNFGNIVIDANCGVCIAPGNSMKLAETVEWLLAHPEEIKQMGQQGYKAMQRQYSWDAEFKKLRKMYNLLLENDRCGLECQGALQ